MKPIVISAFPGCGKTFLFLNNPQLSISDSDSSTFPKEPKGVFPQNYMESIKARRKMAYDYILVSSHDVVREALIKNYIPFVLVYPDVSLKEDFIERYKKRGSPDSFIQLLTDNFEKWVAECENTPVKRIVLTKDKPTLSDVIQLI